VYRLIRPSQAAETYQHLIIFFLQREAAAVKKLIEKYADVPMDVADACVVRMSELNKNSIVFTVDGNFRIYRKRGEKELRLCLLLSSGVNPPACA